MDIIDSFLEKIRANSKIVGIVTLIIMIAANIIAFSINYHTYISANQGHFAWSLGNPFKTLCYIVLYGIPLFFLITNDFEAARRSMPFLFAGMMIGATFTLGSFLPTKAGLTVGEAVNLPEQIYNIAKLVTCLFLLIYVLSDNETILNIAKILSILFAMASIVYFIGTIILLFKGISFAAVLNSLEALSASILFLTVLPVLTEETNDIEY